MSTPNSHYIGRFAPTPTGPLHFGSLVAALASYLDAKAHQGKWLLRIEDLDPPREDPNARSFIPQQLEAHGLFWDDAIVYQSDQAEFYEDALSTLRDRGFIFPCTCSRKQLSATQGRHQGNCHSSLDAPHAWRLSVPNDNVSFNDEIYGPYSQQLLMDVGDQVLKRKDGLYAYQLAVVVDDYLSHVTHIVRGVDLLDNTPRQLYLQQCLRYPKPHYLHLPLVVNDQGQKLSKQNQARAIDLDTPYENLCRALEFLEQAYPRERMSISELLEWATARWQPQSIPPSHGGLIG